MKRVKVSREELLRELRGSGGVSAPGSQKVRAGYEPTECMKCGGKLTLEGPAWISGWNVEREEALAWHIGECPVPDRLDDGPGPE